MGIARFYDQYGKKKWWEFGDKVLAEWMNTVGILPTTLDCASSDQMGQLSG
jgi:hypothetical protein